MDILMYKNNKCKKITLYIEDNSNILYYIFEGGVYNAYKNVFDKFFIFL